MPTVELTTNLLAEIGGWPALKEARALVDRGRVHDAHREGDIICALVQGVDREHEPQLKLGPRVSAVEVKCTCAEFRRHNRVCAHVLAAGLAAMGQKVAAAVPSGGHASAGMTSGRPPLGTAAATMKPRAPRFSLDETPPHAPRVEATLLLPLDLRAALEKDPVRVILEGRLLPNGAPQPWDALMKSCATGFAVSDADEKLLAALETAASGVGGINMISRTRLGAFLRELSGHPRLWLGKKERIEIRAGASRPRFFLQTRPDGTLEMSATSIPAPEQRASPQKEILPGWSFDGKSLMETSALPAGFTGGKRLVPAEKIPEFLSREWPVLERQADLVFAPGFEEFRLEIGQPHFEVRLEGVLSGLTLELIARYDEKEFKVAAAVPSGGRSDIISADKRPPLGTAAATYFPDSRQPNRFWRRNERVEQAAVTRIEAVGFQPARGGGALFTLPTENRVAKFLADELPRWRQEWTVGFGERLEETMHDLDIAQPEFSLRSGSGEDWLSLDLQLSVGGKPVALSQAEIERWLQTGQSHARTADKRVLLIPTAAWGEMKEILTECDVAQEPGKIRVKKTFAPFLAGALTANGFAARESGAAEIPAPDVAATLDPALLTFLRPYQLHGVTWLAGLAQKNFHGLLADDMGLGKTLQALAFGAWVAADGSIGGGRETCGVSNATAAGDSGGYPSPLRVSASPHEPSPSAAENVSHRSQVLVVCPTSLVTNWLREAGRFVPHWKSLDLTGADRAEKWARRGEYDLLVTSYAILRRDIELYRAEEFSLVILDEAQHIKNRGSQNAQAAKALHSRRRLVLTGTPLENSVLDLWSLYDFLLPGYLGTAVDFRERYETPLARGIEPRTMERLRQRVKPFFLRRTKSEVLKELPPKLEFPTLCELSDEQREVYRAVLEQGRRDVFDQSDKAGRKSGRDRLAVLTTLLRLRQVCCHLDLLPGGTTDTSAAPRKWKEPSAKMDRTFELIDEAVDGGHRVLLFSQFVRVLHLLRDEAKRRELPFCYLDGQTVERQAEVDRFQNDASIPLFFISLKAGGTGLNLTGADMVIHFDPWWNPAVEEQATSRAHRLGQARSVSAYKLIAAGTVEEKIQALQSRKRELFEASLAGDEAFVEKMSEEDLEELLAE